jgi:hypothetical protein
MSAASCSHAQDVMDVLLIANFLLGYLRNKLEQLDGL